MALRILAVDDIESNLVALEAILQDSSFSVVRARSGEEALRALLNEEFALILLDVQMPSMDGFETADVIRKREKSRRIPIIFLTAHGSSSEKLARAYAVGAADFLTKPLDAEALRAKIEVIADLWRRIDETKLQADSENQRRLGEERQRWETEALRARVVEQEKLAAAEHAARLEAETANRIKDEFLATLSHELRNPLNAILGWATTLKRKGASGAAMARGLTIIERNAKAQAKLIDDLLDASRIMAGKVRLDLRPIAPRDMFQAVADALLPAAAQKQVTLDVTIEPDVPAISADADRLQQVLTNVISNAIKFTPEGGRVDVRVQESGGEVRIEVTDTGMGIAAPFLPSVFDKFRQGDGATTRLHGGLGIGLSLARYLVELHGGTISAQSQGEGKGATFIIMLPQAGVVAEAAWAMPSGPLSAAGVSLTGIRALVVDDDADSRDLVCEVLESAGATVLAVESADAAVAAFTGWKPDVIVSDIGMPGRDGYALIRQIRGMPEGSPEQVPAAALTAYATADDIAQARQAGFQAHIAKPADASKLIRTVAALAGRLPS